MEQISAYALRQAEPVETGHRLGFNPLQFPICTRTPFRYQALSAWIRHVPFAMCLVDMVRPRVFVELGTYWGISYCAFCQAVKELRLPTKCYAVDTWEGDPHAGFYSVDAFEDLKAHHDEHYSLFSTLVRSTFDEALTNFDAGCIDLLHIDGYHTYDAIRHDFYSWLPKMSDRGVIVIHDIDVRDQETFGVWRFWDEVKQNYPHFEFFHGYGLGVIAVGKRIPNGLRPLISAAPSEAAQVRQYFANLGGHVAELHAIAEQQQNLLQAKTDECIRLKADFDRATAELKEQIAKLAIAHARLSRLRYRAMDKFAHLMRRIPLLPRFVRLVAAAMIVPLRIVRNATQL